jgi:hypothetical protein
MVIRVVDMFILLSLLVVMMGMIVQPSPAWGGRDRTSYCVDNDEVVVVVKRLFSLMFLPPMTTSYRLALLFLRRCCSGCFDEWEACG